MSVNLVNFTYNGLELVINTVNGESYASQRALARMVGRNESTIRDFLTAQDYDVVNAQIFTEVGLRTARLVPEDVIYEAFARYKPELLVQCAKAGIRVYLHKLAGYSFKSKEVAGFKIPKNYLEAQIKEDLPCTILGKAISISGNNINVGEFAKSIKLGQNNYFKELRDDGIIMQRKVLPYQRYIDSGYFVVSEVVNNNKVFPTSFITPKGQVYLAGRHSKYVERCEVEVEMELVLPSLV